MVTHTLASCRNVVAAAANRSFHGGFLARQQSNLGLSRNTVCERGGSHHHKSASGESPAGWGASVLRKRSPQTKC